MQLALAGSHPREQQAYFTAPAGAPLTSGGSTRCESKNCFSVYIRLTGYFTFFLLYSSYSVSPCEVKTILIELDRLTGLVI